MANWFTRFETIKKGKSGLANYINYLKDEKANSHLNNGHKILNIISKDSNFSNMCNVVDNAYNNKILNKKGGRPPSKFGQSIVVAFPFEVEDEKCKELAKSIISNFVIDIFKSENINEEQRKYYINNLTFMNIHKKNEGSRTQINIVLSEYLSNDIKIDLSKKKYSNALKNVVNQQVKKVLNINRNEYQELEKSPKFAKKINNNIYNLIKQKEEQEKQFSKIVENNETLKNRYYSYLKELEELQFKKEQFIKQNKIESVFSINEDIKSKNGELDILIKEIENIQPMKPVEVVIPKKNNESEEMYKRRQNTYKINNISIER